MTLWRAVLAAAAAWAAPPAEAACRIALILALDVSGSVDSDEYRQQLDGIAAALLDTEVQNAILALPDAPVALAAFEWSAADFQRDVVDWTIVDGTDALDRIAATLRARERAYGPTSTALGAAIRHAGRRLAEGPVCWQRVIDISGDGQSNQSLTPPEARRLPDLSGVTINALAIGARRESIDRRAADIAELSAYYHAEVIQGPGSFVETALGYAAYARAIRRKLLRELAPTPVGRAPHRADPTRRTTVHGPSSGPPGWYSRPAGGTAGRPGRAIHEAAGWHGRATGDAAGGYGRPRGTVGDAAGGYGRPMHQAAGRFGGRTCSAPLSPPAAAIATARDPCIDGRAVGPEP